MFYSAMEEYLEYNLIRKFERLGVNYQIKCIDESDMNNSVYELILFRNSEKKWFRYKTNNCKSYSILYVFFNLFKIEFLKSIPDFDDIILSFSQNNSLLEDFFSSDELIEFDNILLGCILNNLCKDITNVFELYKYNIEYTQTMNGGDSK